MIYLQTIIMLYFVISLFLYQPVFCEFSNNKTTSTHYFIKLIKSMSLISEPILSNIMSEGEKVRVKRQGSGAGKFTEAAKMPQVKLLRIFLQCFRNLWSSVHVGGSSPFHPEVPKPVVYLFRDKVMEFFFPDVGAERQKKSL